MAKLTVWPGSTDVSLLVHILDAASDVGAGKTGLAYNTSGLACYYARPGAAAAALSLVTRAVTDPHADGGFVEVDATNLPGVYRLDLSDAVFAAGARSAVVMLQGASGMAPCVLEVDLGAGADIATTVWAHTPGLGGDSAWDRLGDAATPFSQTIPSAPYPANTWVESFLSSGIAVSTSSKQGIADTLLDRTNGIETGVTLRQAQRLQLAAAAGELSGAGTSEVTIRNVGDTKDRIVAEVDASGNRLSVTVDAT